MWPNSISELNRLRQKTDMMSINEVNQVLHPRSINLKEEQ